MNYHVPEHIVARPIQDEIMILDSRHGRYLGLNGSGAMVWTVLEKGGSKEAAVNQLTEAYKVSQQQAESDVVSLIEELLNLRLIVPVTQ